MRSPVTLLFLFLIGTLLIKQVRAPLPHPEENPDPDPAPLPKVNDNDDSTGTSSGDENSGGTSGGHEAPAAPAAPVGQANEQEVEEEDNHYSEILDAVSSLLDAITSIVSDLDDGSSTTISAPLPSAALPCYSVSSIYNNCGLHNSVFPNVIFPVQASCLCYRTSASATAAATWVPQSYDGLISRCNDYAQTQTLASVTKVGNNSADFNLCQSAGDVRATPGLALPSSTSSTRGITTSTALPASSPTTQSAPTPTGSTGGARRNSWVGSFVVELTFWVCRMLI